MRLGGSLGRIMSVRMFLRQRGRCWQGSTSGPNTMRSGKASNTRAIVNEVGSFLRCLLSSIGWDVSEHLTRYRRTGERAEVQYYCTTLYGVEACVLFSKRS